MQAIHTLISSRFQIVGKRICESCGSEVSIIKTVFNGEEKEISHCLQCETKKLEQECNDYYKEREKRKAEMIFERFSFISDDLLNANFDNYIPDHPSKEEAKKKAQWYAKNFPSILNKEYDWQSLLFQGGYGLGKSHLAYSIAQYVKKLGYVVIFLDSPSLLRVIRESYGKDSHFTESEILEMCYEADLLVLDDIGAEYVKSENGLESWATDKLFQVIYARMGKPTIYTTNYKSDELIAKYGQHGGRIVSRMMKGTKVIKFEGKDYRLKGF
ncbi:dnaA-like Chromosomal replication initiator protein [Parageobacillus genomosp. 1]|uniref:DnaA-like Chromosomal replication initiator protein n=1 Tax=Parageobacillus genomosp. 1 TaxID=1295642 RepID=A0ABC9VG64_9BACL|nr:ATP-binding protein [Parageobacillus genomosp. 1]EZP77590.1 dnaA-like Chromosomal replication initiator protein [Parageobacillus genomosp. 1]